MIQDEGGDTLHCGYLDLLSEGEHKVWDGCKLGCDNRVTFRRDPPRDGRGAICISIRPSETHSAARTQETVRLENPLDLRLITRKQI